ncbi:related to PCP1-mitochondrial serine protease [Sporisorium scitamineum]|uniref:Related to PCP1-mitochondrial serine protease n=1 Tax=Sporisorium scitamineum TaxID=49012 RepID=A0A127ZJD9_9BASI|nr:related to PCP1-mitochondrial serine protease [Sporisorium scitamineum]
MKATTMTSSRERSILTTRIQPGPVSSSSNSVPRIGSLQGSRSMVTVGRNTSKINHVQGAGILPMKASTSFLRTFSSTCLHTPSLFLTKRDLPTRDTPGRITTRTRRRPSPLFTPPPPPPPPSPPTPSSLLTLLTRLDQHTSHLPPLFVLYTLLLLNTLILASWLYASALLTHPSTSDPRAYLFLCRNFLSGLPNLVQGRWWTLVTSCISHEQLDHFLVNMVSLWFMAPPVLAWVGPSAFLGLYFGAGVVSSFVSMVGKWWVDGGLGGFSHGASGSVYAIMSVFACVRPRATFLVFFVVPAPAWAVVGAVLGWDVWHAAGTPKGRTDSAGHVGGILAGIAFWRFGLRGLRL